MNQVYYVNVYYECLDCGLEADDNTVTDDGTIVAGTFEAHICPNCGGCQIENK
jgi:predicted RNA-binding Zn-ribbon protein involved in translation (DUF1610 family)